MRYPDYVKLHMNLIGCDDLRDRKAITRLAIAYLKLLFPDLHLTQDEFREYCVQPAVELRQRVRDELHKMDAEYYEISALSAHTINETKKNGGKVIAVGTSTVRVLETEVTSEGWVRAGRGWTDKFIYPPYDFRIVDALVTNFHLPASTLLMLVCAFAGRDFAFKSYRQAIKDGFRFYSYERKQVFAAALKRVNTELKRQHNLATRTAHVEAARKALALHRAANLHDPSLGRSNRERRHGAEAERTPKKYHCRCENRKSVAGDEGRSGRARRAWWMTGG